MSAYILVGCSCIFTSLETWGDGSNFIIQTTPSYIASWPMTSKTYCNRCSWMALIECLLGYMKDLTGSHIWSWRQVWEHLRMNHRNLRPVYMAAANCHISWRQQNNLISANSHTLSPAKIRRDLSFVLKSRYSLTYTAWSNRTERKIDSMLWSNRNLRSRPLSGLAKVGLAGLARTGLSAVSLKKRMQLLGDKELDCLMRVWLSYINSNYSYKTIQDSSSKEYYVSHSCSSLRNNMNSSATW